MLNRVYSYLQQERKRTGLSEINKNIESVPCHYPKSDFNSHSLSILGSVKLMTKCEFKLLTIISTDFKTCMEKTKRQKKEEKIAALIDRKSLLFALIKQLLQIRIVIMNEGMYYIWNIWFSNELSYFKLPKCQTFFLILFFIHIDVYVIIHEIYEYVLGLYETSSRPLISIICND